MNKPITATQVFIIFLKKECTNVEYFYFKNIILHDTGNKYFRRRRLWKDNLVESYLSNNGRTLQGFMKRLFILAPNLVSKRFRIVNRYISSGCFVNRYHKKWKTFLDMHIIPNDKSFLGKFKKNDNNRYFYVDDKLEYLNL